MTSLTIFKIVVGILFGLVQAPAPNPYHLIENWAKLPAGMEWGQVSGVEFDVRGNLWVIHRTDPPILEFDPSGNLIKSIGSGMFVQAHSLHFDRDGNLWATDGQAKDGKGNQVFKFGPDGKVLLTLGKAGITGDAPDVFNGVCDIVSAPNGDVFIADGHANTRVLKFSKDGKFIATWGKKGTGQGEFDIPHAIAMDSAGRVFVGDRANNRIQIFDQNGKYIAEWKQFGRPTGLYISKDDTLYVADDESNPTRNPGFTPGVYVGSAKDGSVKAFIPTGNTERAVADAKGNIYTAVLGGKTVRKYEK
jgi:sugar lactone lactonase YvrE